MKNYFQEYKIKTLIQKFNNPQIFKIQNTNIMRILIIGIIIFFNFSCSSASQSRNIGENNNSDSFQLFVKDYNSKSRVININQKDSILDLKGRIRDVTGIQEKDQGLLYRNTNSFDNSSKVIDCFSNQSTITLCSPLNGGVKDTFKFVNFKDKNQPITMFSNLAPAWHGVNRGLNLIGVCENSKCKAYGHTVSCDLKSKSGKMKNRYKGDIDLSEIDTEDQFKNPFLIVSTRTHCYCPICEDKIRPETVTKFGFYDCRYDIFGDNYDTGKIVTNMGNKIEKGRGFILFDGDDIQDWYSICVVTRKFK